MLVIVLYINNFCYNKFMKNKDDNYSFLDYFVFFSFIFFLLYYVLFSDFSPFLYKGNSSIYEMTKEDLKKIDNK